MLTEQQAAEVRIRVQRWKSIQQRVALVPTMGNLHAGHVALVKRAQQLADRVVVSIFVNPMQFGQGEDFQAYPRTPDADRVQLAAAGTDLLFAPDVDEVYPQGLQGVTYIKVPGLSDILDGAFRPGHFIGVTTVVAKLLNIVQPDVAVFGEKDYQQLAVIRRMVADLCLPVEIAALATVRETDGLAMSSRNQYLTQAERAVAPVLYKVLHDVTLALRDGNRKYAELQQSAVQRLSDAGFRPEYVEIRHAVTLAAPAGDETKLVVLAAAWLGKARLIDNIGVDTRLPADRTVNLSQAESVG